VGKGRKINIFSFIMSNEKIVPEQGKLIGKITHYFPHVEVAVIKLSRAIKVGDKIRIVGGETDFEQEVESMEVDHKKIKTAKKSDDVGLKISQKVREGYKVYKL
jgi:putative protease